MKPWEAELVPITDPNMLGFDTIVGGTIERVGQIDCDPEGALAIDYKRKDGVLRRVVLDFTELGIWVVWEGVIGAEFNQMYTSLLQKFTTLDEYWKTFVVDEVGEFKVVFDAVRRAFFFLINGTEVMALTASEVKTLPKVLRKILLEPDPKMDKFVFQLASDGYFKKRE